MSVLLLGASAFLLAVYATSVIGKLRSADARRGFARSVRNWRLLPERFAGRAARTLIAAEAVVAVGLVGCVADCFASVAPLRAAPLVATVAALGVSAGLTGGVAVLVRRGTGARCACFGAREKPLRGAHVTRNILITLVALAGSVAATTSPAAGPSAAAATVAVGTALIAAVVVIHLDALADLFAPSARRRVPVRSSPTLSSGG